MARVWLKLEAIEAIQVQQQHYLKHVERFMALYPASERFRDLKHMHVLLEQEMSKLQSIIQTRIYVGKHLVEFARNPLQSDERFELETRLKNGKHRPYFA